ncbi:hypothetical protein E1B28_010316 [Marasmius oreades]|uniref:MACPF domain-containing protein n=1 Tax=Marasmius oreades TaxID=181124 RepID=A0A9P7RY22_9AGAR|nr:uncharacterized protein E1B28_010316 [Marasmius oreades]KAG7091266.1 hypothetical protein E1B28_010316 [Marasmius oreades]
MADFPALNWLGYSMNMLGTTPLDTTSAMKAVLTTRRIIEIDESNSRTVTIDGKDYEVPRSIGVQTDANVIDGFVHYPSGNEAVVAFHNDSSLAAQFMSITGDPSVGRATEKHHRTDIQYAYYTFGQAKYLALMRNYADSLNEDALLKAFETLSKPFNGKDENNVKKYSSFFQCYGTHVITKVQYGAHYQLHIWASNTNTSFNDSWSANVKVDYDGIPSSRQFDPSVKDTLMQLS